MAPLRVWNCRLEIVYCITEWRFNCCTHASSEGVCEWLSSFILSTDRCKVLLYVCKCDSSEQTKAASFKPVQVM
jgi:hypothetical protein